MAAVQTGTTQGSGLARISQAQGALLGAGVAAAGGLLADALAPRGAATTAQVLATMAIALVVGVAGGCLARTRWVLLLQLAAWMVAVEIGRRGVAVPSLDVRLDTVYGIIALLITRGLDGILLVLPLATGVLAGLPLGRRLAGAPTVSRRLPVGSVMVGGLTLGLAVLVAWPASTPPVLRKDGATVTGGVAELATVNLGGADQAVMIRGASTDKPVVLYLSGGPGQSDLPLARVLSAGWTDDVVFVDLDQRGNGKSYAAIDPLASMTLDQAVSDVIELTDYLRERFGQDKITLMGESWGSILGVLAVQRRPDLYHAWIGSGQMVDVLETDRRIYADLLAYGNRVGDDDLLASLVAIGSPPYRDIPWANSNLLAWYEYLYKPYTPSEGYRTRGHASGLDPFGVLGSEYAFIEKRNVLRGLIDTFTVMYPQLYDLDFRISATHLEVPVYILDGKAELEGRRSVMLEWYEQLEAPSKQLVSFDGAAHSVAFEQADEVLHLLTETVFPAADAP
ncbi:MAG TPA: alpha/beta hydrolase [Candidatus Limnocylindrales bacterium]|nr:alpha/beta hydrolase [Candidatus Limnocylindrales bacterium]